MDIKEAKTQQQVRELFDRFNVITPQFEKWHRSLTLKFIKSQFYDIFGEELFKDLENKQ